MEREKVKEREPEIRKVDLYEQSIQGYEDAIKRAQERQVVIKGKERGWHQSRQGYLKWFLHPSLEDTVTTKWSVFIHDIHTHSGRHIHQGGLAIFVLEGNGYTVVDGQRFNWEAGDLVLLPIKPGGVEHQHFNAELGKPCKWMAFIYKPLKEALGNRIRQVEEAPQWQQQRQVEHQLEHEA